MKVMFNTYPMAFHTPGGGEMQLRAYHRHLRAHGIHATLFDQWQPDFLSFDVVHFFSCVGGSVHFCHFVKQLGLPLVITSSLWITEETTHLYPTPEIRAQLALADCIITNSDTESDMLARVLSLPRENFAAVYNGIDDFFLGDATAEPFRQAFGIDGPFVLNVGNIEPRKNQLALAQAMKALPDHQLILIGHQRDPAYAERVLATGGEQVRYIGPMDHSPLLLSAYRACDVFCLPSTLETPGLAALEALGQGASLVVTREGSCQEYFGDAAVYIDPANVGSIVAGMRQALDEGVPDAARRARSQTLAARFLWPETTRALRDIYARVATRRTASPRV